MKILKNKLSFALQALIFLAACTSSGTNTDKQPAIAKEEIIFTANPEPMGKKTDVYDSMARAVKYNVDQNVRNIRDKLRSTSVKNILESSKESSLYDAAKVLDFSIIYAAFHLFNNTQAEIDYLYEKASENLALGAISAHKNALFADKKIKEIERLEAKEMRQVAELDKKQERRGGLGDEESLYKKEIEAALYRLNNLKTELSGLQQEYALLVKADKNFALEGRKFYELEGFLKKYNIENFQRLALKKRFENKFVSDMGYSYNYNDVRNMVLDEYPETERLTINGYDIHNPLYLENLRKVSIKAAEDLTSAVDAYMAEKNAEKKNILRKDAAALLNMAVFLQIETNFDIVAQADFYYSENLKEIASLKKEIAELNKIYRMNNQNKIKLLNKKIELLNFEYKMSNIMAERAFSLRALYFNAGLSPFNRAFLNSNVKNISQGLKAAFNHDMVEMLAQVSGIYEKTENKDKGWAKGDNWLENLLEKPKKSIKSDLDSGYLYKGAAFDKKKIMQLGSYKERKNIENEWAMLQELFPELKQYSPRIEKIRVRGEPYYRLVIQSANGGFMDLCNKIRNNRMDCLLR